MHGVKLVKIEFGEMIEGVQESKVEIRSRSEAPNMLSCIVSPQKRAPR